MNKRSRKQVCIESKTSPKHIFRHHLPQYPAQHFFNAVLVVVLLIDGQSRLGRLEKMQIKTFIWIYSVIFQSRHVVTSHYCFAHFQKWKCSGLVTFLDSWRACLLCLCIFYFCFYEEIAEVAWASVCDERFFRKNFFATVWGLKYGEVFRNDLVKVWRSWIVGDNKWDALVAFVLLHLFYHTGLV